LLRAARYKKTVPNKSNAIGPDITKSCFKKPLLPISAFLSGLPSSHHIDRPLTHSCICIPTPKPGRDNPSNSFQLVYWQISTHPWGTTLATDIATQSLGMRVASFPVCTMPIMAKVSCLHNTSSSFRSLASKALRLRPALLSSLSLYSLYCNQGRTQVAGHLPNHLSPVRNSGDPSLSHFFSPSTRPKKSCSPLFPGLKHLLERRFSTQKYSSHHLLCTNCPIVSHCTQFVNCLYTLLLKYCCLAGPVSTLNSRRDVEKPQQLHSTRPNSNANWAASVRWTAASTIHMI